MNKQELINSVKAWGAWCTDHNTGEKDRYVKIDKVRELIEQLDEQPKVTVPKFVADWIEECKRNATLTDCLIGDYMDYKLIKEAEAFRAWRTEGENEEIAARAWMFGYEVEKEPIYEVVFLEDDNGRYLLMELSEKSYEVVHESENDGYRTQWFTESEIKSIDERYWAFAVPVEEVK
ncbi:DUF1642 domain-containing protein [Enterococcus gallinarum]|uniref:DUF1642 domain-containing protein n=1 Tax=Enterococcus gallinarum TaxID=1353 RepID=UPI0018AAA54B|nr:DUF1642 domain-containing protein [Enterococcus gallinarum]